MSDDDAVHRDIAGLLLGQISLEQAIFSMRHDMRVGRDNIHTYMLGILDAAAHL